MNDLTPGPRLAHFAATLRLSDVPAPVQRRAEDLLLDWIGSALAGKGARLRTEVAKMELRAVVTSGSRL